MIKVQETFGSGMDLLSSDTQIDDKHYQWLVNARNRFNFLEPINSHIEITNKPVGLLQGGIGVGNIKIIFVHGFAYWNREGETSWKNIPNFAMSMTAPQYWTQAVPVSSFHFSRQYDAASGVHASMKYIVDYKINGSPACIVVQDNETQPHIIIWDDVNQLFTARPAQTYQQWKNIFSTTTDLREYVPIGNIMAFVEGKLLIVAPDKKSVYHSISGRPLDFMVNIKPDGTKVATEQKGGAHTVSFAFDYDEITCIRELNVPSSFVYATSRNIRILTFDFNNTVFGEPRPYTAALMEAGIVNQYSFLDVHGEYMFIDFDQVKTFNAVTSLKFRGRNSHFSQLISKLIKKVKQQKPVCIEFDNFCLFNIDTKYGNIVVVYDSLNGDWASMDVTEVTRIKQFFVTETLTESILYAITWDDKMFKMYYDTSSREVAMLRTKSFTADVDIKGKKTSIEHKSNYFRPFFNGGTYEGTVSLVELVDEQESVNNRETKPLKTILGGLKWPLRFPFIWNTEQRVENPTFSLTRGLTGKKISFIITWSNDAKLVEYEVATTEMSARVSQRQINETLKQSYATNS